MAWHRERLEERQALVARLAEIGVDLFVISATAAYAAPRPATAPLAQQVFLDARRRIAAAFAELADNDDRATRQLGEHVLNGAFTALLNGGGSAEPASSPPLARGRRERERSSVASGRVGASTEDDMIRVFGASEKGQAERVR